MPERKITQFIRDRIFFHFIDTEKIYGMMLKINEEGKLQIDSMNQK